MQKTIIILLLFLPLITFSQECDCNSNFEWVKKTFEENDAGFQYAIDSKGKNAYKQHNKEFKERVSQIKNVSECSETLFEWLTFFRSGHIGLSRINPKQNDQSKNKKSDQQIRDSFKDWEKVDVSTADFKTYLSKKEKQDYEGIWVSEPYVIGIKKIGSQYKGFIIEADGVYWTKGQVKLSINEDGSSAYYMQDHSEQNFESAQLLGTNYLEMGFISLERSFPKMESEPHIEKYFKAISSRVPYFEKVNDQTVMLRIPSFNWSYKKDIDSLLTANKEIILSTPNLIIDIRNNGGGSDTSYYGLLPYLYTNPIRTVGVEFLSTELNNKRMIDIMNGKYGKLSETQKEQYQSNLDKLNKQLGEFVMLNKHPISVTQFPEVHEFPKNVAIVINKNNGSTAEQFLLAVKQSKKVKLFGTTTAGVLDISNMYFVQSPCNELELGYSLSKSMRIPEMAIDGKGIQPDYYIDKQVPKYEWIKFVTEILNE